MEILSRIIDITPIQSCHLGGNSETITADEIHLKLETNLLLIKEFDQIKLLITMDLLYVGEEIAKGILDFASKFIPLENIWISASHCHNAPHVDSKKPKLGQVDSSYLKMVISQINFEIESMMSNLKNCEIVNTRVKVSHAPLTINRRKRRLLTFTRNGLIFNKVQMLPNKKGFIDPLIRKLEFLDKNGQLVAVMWQYTCHPTSFYDPHNITSHYIGEIRNDVRKRSTSNIPVLFMQGFAGDVRPPSSRKFYEKFTRNILQGYQFRDFTRTEYEKWINKLIKSFNSDVEIKSSGKYLNKKSMRKTWDSSHFVSGSSSNIVTLQIMPIGPICLVGLSCEPTVSLSRDFLYLSELGEIWPCGYLEDVYGYLPSYNEILIGGYEVEGFCSSFSCDKLTYDGWKLASKEIVMFLSSNSS